MSLVLDALRRVEKPHEKAGSVGVMVSSYRPVPKPGRSFLPLVMGALVGGALVLLFGPGVGSLPPEPSPLGGPATPPAFARGGAGLPPPIIIEPSEVTTSAEAAPRAPAFSTDAPVSTRRAGAAPAEEGTAVRGDALVLQALSEREGTPIAVINDQLVKEGDLVGRARVLRIGRESVEVRLENGTSATVRFAPPPPEVLPSPDVN